MSSIAALRLVTARAAPAGRRMMGGGTVSRRVRRPRGAPQPSTCALDWSFSKRYVGSTHSRRRGARRRTFHAPRRRRRDCLRARTPPEPPRPAQFDGKPFNKGSMAASVIATVAGGAGVICFAAFFQNKKHGFIK